VIAATRTARRRVAPPHGGGRWEPLGNDTAEVPKAASIIGIINAPIARA